MIEFCECDYPNPNNAAICQRCGIVIECDLSFDEPHPATHLHIDRVVCDAHLEQAVSDVLDRDE